MKEETEISKELYEALSLTMDKVRSAFSNSAFYQLSEYVAINNGTENWYFKANNAMENYRKITTNKKE